MGLNRSSLLHHIQSCHVCVCVLVCVYVLVCVCVCLSVLINCQYLSTPPYRNTYRTLEKAPEMNGWETHTDTHSRHT